MTNNRKLGILTLLLGIIFAGCASVPKGTAGTSAAVTPKLAETIGKYTAPEIQNWGNDGDVFVYYIDANRFNEFKAEMDNGGEYRQAGTWTENNRDWRRGLLFARVGIVSDGRISLFLCRANNSGVGYWYTKLTQAAMGVKLQESLHRYNAPSQEDWGGEYGIVSVYNLDTDRFNEFKAELDSGNEYIQVQSYTENNHYWERGKTFAQFIVRQNSGLELRLIKPDNSFVLYRYIPAGVPIGDSKLKWTINDNIALL